MKNILRLLAVASFVFVGNAHAKTQTMISGTAERPVTVSVNGQFDAGGYTQAGEHGLGPKALGGNIGVSHFVGDDFEYSLNAFGGYASTLQFKLFGADGKFDGFKMGVDLSARYLPVAFSTVRLGGLVSIGYGRLFGEGAKRMNDQFSFGDMNFDVGPAFMHQATTFFAWGFGITYGMTEMRFGSSKASAMAKQYSNLHTVRLPINFLVQATDYLGVTLAVDPAWRHLGGNHKFYHGLFYDVVAGVNLNF